MVDYTKLKNELDYDPGAIGYSGMSDQQVVDTLNAMSETELRETRLTALGVMRVLGANEGASVLDALESAAGSNPVVKWVMVGIVSQGVDMADANARSVLDQLVSAGTITLQNSQDLKAVAEYQISRAEKLGIGFVKVGHVQEVRR